MSEPARVVDEHLRACLPPDVPPSYREIVAAKVVKSGRKKAYCADVIMFDGAPATVEVFTWGEAFGGFCWGHRWTDMPGGAVSYENGRWRRRPDLSAFMDDLFARDLFAATHPKTEDRTDGR